jgi:hypothetical protein
LVQQDIRQSANDPQIQDAEDIAQSLSLGAPADEIIPPGQTADISTSLDPFVIIYSATGTVIESSAVLNDATPTLPSGVFTDVTQHGEDRITWQPGSDVRIAAVIEKFGGQTPGFILVGRSIREVEDRESNIGNIALFAWLAGLIVMFAVIWIVVGMYHKKIAV